jgi:hypothetical protein
MVAPVTGPYTRVVQGYGPPCAAAGNFVPVWRYSNQRWYRQAKPYRQSLPYSMDTRRIVSQNNTSAYYKTVQNVPVFGYFSEIAKQRLYNKAYESFMGQVRSAQADVMTLMRERQKSLSMIQTRALQLVIFIQAARKGNVKLMKQVVRQASVGDQSRKRSTMPKVGIKKKLKLAGSHVLEYSFGWAPLVSDIQGAMKVFDEGPPRPVCKGRARASASGGYTTGTIPTEIVSATETIGWTLRSRIRVVNSDLLLLNSLGLVNLASSIWETTPWSFVFDYFVNVQTFLNSFTDRLGLEFEDASSTFLGVCDSRVLYKASYTPEGGWPHYKSQYITMTRQLGISRPTLAWKSPWQLSPARALTSIALLLQKLKG